MEEPVLSRAAVRALDRRTIEELGLPALVLMENAGRAAADEAERMLAGAGGAVHVVLGPGNNGGDGLVVARTLANRGHAVRATFVGPAERLARAEGDFGTNLALWRALGGEVDVVEEAAGVAVLGRALRSAALVVDALFGTGLARAVGEPWRAVIAAVNESGRAVLALDLPSGLDADTGAVLGVAVRADVTVTFVARKAGFLCGRGPELCGRVVVAEIGVPRAWIAAAVAR